MTFRQTNHEGQLIDWVQEAADHASALIMNPAGYGHTSVALHDALKLLGDGPYVEVHLSDPAKREAFRRESFTAPLAQRVIAGHGAQGYVMAVDAAEQLIRERVSP